MSEPITKHDFWPTKAELEQFQTKSPSKMPPMDVEVLFEEWVARRIGVDVIAFTVPAGFRLPEWVSALNKDCEVNGKSIMTATGKPKGFSIQVAKAGKILFQILAAYKAQK